ncbi:MAG: hypothetical protein ACXWU7_07530, partial [Telluria sp.]
MSGTDRHTARWKSYLRDCDSLVGFVEPMQVSGRVTRVAGLVMECVGLKLAVGSACTIPLASGARIEAEVVGFEGERLFLMPQSDIEGVVPGTRVFPVEASVPRPGTVDHPRRRPSDRARHLPVGDKLLGRVVDGAGRPLDGLGPLGTDEVAPINARPVNPLDRAPITETLDVGVRAINAMLTVGRGQRLGLFAGTGVGKSVLLGMIARYTTADVIVVGLIGERGREVKEFIEQILGPEGRARSAVVAAPADSPPLMRLQGAAYATAIAEHFRDQGKSVLLIMDSLTRYAMAQREIALAIGERGREVKEFIEQILGPAGLARSVVVAAPADTPPLMRLQGAAYATAIAEHFRDEGKNVLLIMDSLTRYAMAQREIALAIGEPPATKGYPPSCFAKLPQLVERSGNGLHGVGSITAFYTVLSEGDDQQDPIADAARAIL